MPETNQGLNCFHAYCRGGYQDLHLKGKENCRGRLCTISGYATHNLQSSVFLDWANNG